MANFTKNLTNAVGVFGVGPSTKWGQALGTPYTMTWGTSKWGDGALNCVKSVKKVVSNVQSATWDPSSKSILHFFEIASFTIATEIDNTIGRHIAFGSVSPTLEMSSEQLSQGNWHYVFTSNTDQAEDRDAASWSRSTPVDATFTCQAAGSTTWSET